MISYAVYKVLHLTGVMMVFLSLGGVAIHAMNGGGKSHYGRKWVGITHGLGLVISLVAGFGLLARLGFVQAGMPGWAIAKLVIWAIFGGIIAVFIRKPNLAKPLWILTITLGVLAAYIAGSKPF